MAKAYWVNTYRSISDPAAMAEYAKLAGPAVESNGGRFLIRGNPAHTYESGLMQRVVVVEFDSLEQALKAHDSDAYQAALKALGNGAERDIRIAEGVAERLSGVELHRDIAGPRRWASLLLGRSRIAPGAIPPKPHLRVGQPLPGVVRSRLDQVVEEAEGRMGHRPRFKRVCSRAALWLFRHWLSGPNSRGLTCGR